ncbi:FAM92 protein [Trinorchestia longiramus]|nr:FAM92 protein [Trinorchestia longiramus]
MTPPKAAVVSELQRLAKEESNFKQLGVCAAQYSSAIAKLRDQADVFARQLQVLSSNSPSDLPNQRSVPETAQCISQVQDYRTLLVDRLHDKVEASLKDCQKDAADTRAKLKKIHATKNRRNQKSRTVTSVQEAASDHHARVHTRLWRTMRDFLQTELAFHVKAVELYSTACSTVLHCTPLYSTACSTAVGEQQSPVEASVFLIHTLAYTHVATAMAACDSLLINPLFHL